MPHRPIAPLRHFRRALLARCDRLGRDADGNIAITFAIARIPIVAMVGAAVAEAHLTQ